MFNMSNNFVAFPNSNSDMIPDLFFFSVLLSLLFEEEYMFFMSFCLFSLCVCVCEFQ
jgi:hypothetical protein